ncbi:hypothetical protein RIVM261_011350 [Rivularia sp. IAM M-261]|nr:hypothetical protein RIVM261_011350 [Rivularia sp. IAM M-261]
MAIWILTVGNSDIRLKHDKSWDTLYPLVQDDFMCGNIVPTLINSTDKSQGFSLPARALGLVYENQPEYYEDLEFPLIDTYYSRIKKEEIKLEKVIILLTDQTSLFPEWQQQNEKCPYWQDTLTLKLLFIEYFNKLRIESEFIILKPLSNKGLDHWDATLKLVNEKLDEKLKELDISQNHTVYVSHQAGTPAISSALQFVSLGKFNEVNYLVSNQYYDDDFNQKAEPEIINSSEYKRGIEIQKAKQLITNGFPGAALKVLAGLKNINSTIILELNKFRDLFNIKNNSNPALEFQVKSASERIVIALDLIEIFFDSENFIQGVTLLASTQETFMKVAIISQLEHNNETIRGVKASKLVKWSVNGLLLQSDGNIRQELNLKYSDDIIKEKITILEKLAFPVNDTHKKLNYWDKYNSRRDINFWEVNSNLSLYKWLQALKPSFKAWRLLEWASVGKDENKEFEYDIRNQIMHNLRGVEEKDVIKYLAGNQDVNISTAKETYIEKVKKPFLKALKLFGLVEEYEIENSLEKQLKKIADTLS